MHYLSASPPTGKWWMQILAPRLNIEKHLQSLLEPRKVEQLTMGGTVGAAHRIKLGVVTGRGRD